MVNKPLISIKTSFIIALLIVICSVLFTVLLENNSTLMMIFGDIFPILIDLLVVLTLFYATARSFKYGKKVQMAWMFIGFAFIFYTVGDIVWAILEIGIHQSPFPSIADGFYLIYYPLFAVGIYYLSRFSFTKTEKLKIFLDMAIIIISVGLTFWTFLIFPTLSNGESSFVDIISIIYIVFDFLLFFVLLRGIYSKYHEQFMPILFLSLSILVMIVTDIIFAFQTLQGTYVSGGFLDTGWIISFVLVGLAAFLQATPEKLDISRYSQLLTRIQKYNPTSYLPYIWVLIVFIVLVWANPNQSAENYVLIEIVVGIIIFLVIIRQFITLRENKNLLTLAQKEIESRKIAEKTALENEIYYRAIFENTGTSMLMIEHDMTISRVNSQVEVLTGYSKEEIEGKKKWTDFAIEEENEGIKGYCKIKNDPDKRTQEYETKGMDKNGEIKDLLVTVVTIPGTKKQLVSLMDITERKTAENQIKSSLKEKNILLKEIHHRVKNNMQIISSLLSLQTKYVNDEEALDILKESQNRVRSMAIIHEKLYQSKDLSQINFADYIQSLVSNLFYSYNANNTHIKPVYDIEDLSLNIDTAVPCGLIISELVSNSLKYAFPTKKIGEILVSLKYMEGKYQLIVSDNGVGMPKVNVNKLDSLGLLLVFNLTEQLEGNITIKRDHGTEFIITFEEISYKKEFEKSIKNGSLNKRNPNSLNRLIIECEDVFDLDYCLYFSRGFINRMYYIFQFSVFMMPI
ncbi:MAG: PAS domain S-box protein [Methanobacterium sp. ERen5]|nr:MAG: PAS domain S-box protein [Methanobacterium sp. ERen5]